MSPRTITMSLILVCLTSYCAASPLAYEGFDYAAGDLNGQSGGIGFLGSWAGNALFDVTGGSLSYPTGFPPTGNSLTTPVLDANKDIHRDLATAIGTPGTTAYISFLIRPEGTVGAGYDNGTLGLIASAGPLTSNDLYIGKPGAAAPNSNLYAIENVGGTGHHATSVAAVADETVVLVLRADFTAGVDTFRLYVNPPETGVEPLIADATKADSNISSITRLYIAGSAAFSIDEIRIGTTYADVFVPEPSTLMLAAFGMFGLTVYRVRLKRVKR